MLGKHLNFSLSRDKDSEKPITLVDNTASGPDLCQKVCEDITQFYVTLANEPSLAYFRIQEHIRKITPSLLNERSKIVQVNSELQGCCFDVDYSISAVNSASRATPHLNRLNELLKSSLFTKLQLDYAKKYSTGFEVGVDLVSALASQQQPAISTTSRKKIPAGSQLPSSSYFFGRNTSSTLEPVNSSPSTTLADSSQLTSALLTTAVRQNPVSINKRAQLTRSADLSGLNGPSLFTSLRNEKARSVVLHPSYSFTRRASLDQSAETGVEAVELHDSTDN
ncbi:BLOC-1- complex subunit 8 [Clonorchis sinensis]|uniref:BLOC-1- complex subunit 8 n=1 Tax=Clonorchis sinensis TaxID=79923 RepID=A0A8T1LST3_CLOSI|nr:BLOC-1- complex subunit 8 [Clonorchis sinensis]